MIIFREWFYWNTGQMFFCAIGILILAILPEWNRNKSKLHCGILFCSVLVYVIGEVIVSNWLYNGWIIPKTVVSSLYMLSGTALSIFLGRVCKLVLINLKKPLAHAEVK